MSLSAFSNPFLLGFDHLERTLEHISKSTNEGYPPYNVEQTGENEWRLTLAVAGFNQEDLSVTIEDNQLVIRGKQAEDEDRNYLHRGIATRQFQKRFVLADGMEPEQANLDNGLLSIKLIRPEPNPRVREIEIMAD